MDKRHLTFDIVWRYISCVFLFQYIRDPGTVKDKRHLTFDIVWRHISCVFLFQYIRNPGTVKDKRHLTFDIMWRHISCVSISVHLEPQDSQGQATFDLLHRVTSYFVCSISVHPEPRDSQGRTTFDLWHRVTSYFVCFHFSTSGTPGQWRTSDIWPLTLCVSAFWPRSSWAPVTCVSMAARTSNPGK